MSDRLIKFLFRGAPVRGELVRVSDAWREMTAHHSYPRPVKRLLGEMVAAAALLASNIKFNGALIMQVHGDGPVKLLVVECQPDLAMRATAKLGEEPIDAQASMRQLINRGGRGRFAITLDPRDPMPGQQPYQGIVPLDGVSEGYHTLSHHGQDDEKLRQLALVETEIVKAWGDFLRGLKRIQEGAGTLLDRTAVLLTSNLGNASSHRNVNMPVLFAGGGFKHGQHLAFDQQKNYPLSNLFVSLLQRHGLEEGRFATGTSTFAGLEFA